MTMVGADGSSLCQQSHIQVSILDYILRES